MKWFVYPAIKRTDKDIYDREKTFITRKEYDALIRFCRFDCEKALWETFYLTGARPKGKKDIKSRRKSGYYKRWSKEEEIRKQKHRMKEVKKSPPSEPH